MPTIQVAAAEPSTGLSKAATMPGVVIEVMQACNEQAQSHQITAGM